VANQRWPYFEFPPAKSAKVFYRGRYLPLIPKEIQIAVAGQREGGWVLALINGNRCVSLASNMIAAENDH